MYKKNNRTNIYQPRKEKKSRYLLEFLNKPSCYYKEKN